MAERGRATTSRRLPVDTQLTAGLADVSRDARELADVGFDGVFSFEGRHDPFLPLGLAASCGLDLMTNIAVAFPRSPLQLAQAAYDLQALSGGRFRLGLGSQVRAHVERRYGAAWSRPVERMADIVRATRAVLTCWQDGTRLNYEGEFVRLTLMTPMFDPGPNPHGIPPILVGGLGPRMVAMAAEVADGVLVHAFNSDRFVRGRTLAAVGEGLTRAGRDRDAITIVAQFIVAAYRTEQEQERAQRGVRDLLAFYASTPAYRPVLDVEGYGDLQPELNRLSKENRWAEMPALVDDELLGRLAVVGTPAEVARQILRRCDGVADRAGVYLPYEAPAGCVREVLAEVRSAAGRGGDTP